MLHRPGRILVELAVAWGEGSVLFSKLSTKSTEHRYVSQSVSLEDWGAELTTFYTPNVGPSNRTDPFLFFRENHLQSILSGRQNKALKLRMLGPKCRQKIPHHFGFSN